MKPRRAAARFGSGDGDDGTQELRSNLARQLIVGPPATFDAFCQIVQDRKIELPRRLAAVASFLIHHPDEAAFGPIAKIAAKAELSPSAFVRLAQNLGFAGFSELQALFERRLLANNPRRSTDDDAEGDMLSNVARAVEQSVRRLDAKTSRPVLDRAVQLLTMAHTVFLVSQPDVGHSVMCLRHALSVSGIRNMPAGGTFGLIDETLAFASRDDVVIVVDLPPYDSKLADRVGQLRKRAVPLVVITDSRLHSSIDDDIIWFELADDEPLGLAVYTGLTCLSWALAGEVRRQRSG